MVSQSFQIVNWYTTDIEVDQSDDSDDGESHPNNEDKSKYVIKLFGVDENGSPISVSVMDFTPHFYVKVDKLWSMSDRNNFKSVVIKKMGKYQNSLMDVVPIRKKDFWGFTNNEEFWFVRLRFKNHRGMKMAARIISGLNYTIAGQRKFTLYESNIEPFLRFAHLQNIQPAGWVEISKFHPTTDVLSTKCKTDIQTSWKHVHPIEKEAIAPLNVASFDLECMSSDGDFPVASKNYQKMATDIYNMFHDLKKKRYDDYDVKKNIVDYFCNLFEKKLIVSKVLVKTTDLANKLNMHMDHMCSIIQGDRNIMDREFNDVFLGNFKKNNKVFYGKNPEIENKRLQQLEEKLLKKPDQYLKLHKTKKDEGLTSTALRKYMNACLVNCFTEYEDIRKKDGELEDNLEILIKVLFGDKDGVISVLTKYLNEFMPPLEGDEIIQIGTTYHRYGDSEVGQKVIFTLNTCDKIEGIDVRECKTEEDMIMQWAELIETSDPDIITGYNIFGFDFSYIYERSKELGINREFCATLSRIKEVSDDRVKIGQYKEAKLSSSAMGDNLMKYIEMEGRTHIDLMKVVQREHKLDSYKLDAVASHFMKMNKHDVSPQDIFNMFKKTAKDRAIVADYCIQDCALCNKLMMKLEIIANNVGMANVCSVPFGWIFMRGQGVKIFSLVAKECKENGFLVPVIHKIEREDMTEDELKEDDEGYEGAIVLEPKTGIYIDTPVTVLDYASLYPSSMISENISHDAIVLDDKYGDIPGLKYEDIAYDLYEQDGDEKKKIGEKVCRFVQPPNGEKGVIPNILNNLLQQRKLTRKKIGLQKVVMKDGNEYEGFFNKETGKLVDIDGTAHVLDVDGVSSSGDLYNNFQKAVLDGLQLAYKVTANSLYGQLGSKMSPLFLKPLAACTTATGRNMIMKAKEFMEKEYNAHTVYGDSVSGDTPLLIRFPNGVVDIRTIETLSDEWKPYKEFAKEGSQKEQAVFPAQVWTEGEWSPIARVIRHRTTKKMYRVNTFRGCVDVTEDHSLVGVNGDMIKPGECIIGETDILHTFPTEFKEFDIPTEAFNHNNGDWMWDMFPDMYKCTHCFEKYDIGMYYVEECKRGTKGGKKTHHRRVRTCKLCIKERSCKRRGVEFDGLIHDKVLRYKVEPHVITKEEAWVWGLFFGDGSCGDYDCESGVKRTWAINNSNMMFLDKAKKWLENVEPSNVVTFKQLDTIASSGVYKLVAQGSPAYMVEKYRALFYDKDDFKKVPTIILNATQEIKLWFMKGYLTADGTKREMSEGKWDFACKGKIGAQGLFYLMKSVGFKDIRVNIQFDHENTYWIRNIIDPHYLRKSGDKVMKIQELPETTEDMFVYDIETTEGVFHGGVGEVLLKNTDSLFLTFPDHLKDENGNKLLGKAAIQRSIDIGIEASKKFKPLLKAPHDLEYEKIFAPMILFSKKRYCANKYEFDVNKFKQNSMGIALKRRDNANIVKYIYGGAIDIILNKHDIKESITFLKKSLNELIAGKFPLEELVITKTLKAHYKDPDKIAHKVLAERIKERSPGNAPQVNDRIPYIYVRVEEGSSRSKVKVLQGDRIEHPEYIREKKLKPDYAFYLTNQVMNPVLQLYALVLEQLDGYKKSESYWDEIRKQFEREDRSSKQIKEKIQDMREMEAKKILFDPILLKLEHEKTGQTQLTDYFKVLPSS